MCQFRRPCYLPYLTNLFTPSILTYSSIFFGSFPVYSPDPYVTVQILGTPNGVKKTRHVPNTSDPEWNETLDEFYIDPKRDHLIEFVLYDLNRTVNEEIGREVFDFYGFSSDTDNNIVISFKNVSHTKVEFTQCYTRLMLLISIDISIKIHQFVCIKQA